MKPITIRLINALIVALITFVSSLSIQFPPNTQNIWAGFIAFMLTLLTQIKSILSDYSGKSTKQKLMVLI